MIRALIASVILAAASVSVAAAQETVHVSYADLNLATTEGASTFERRIDHAVEKICGPVPGKMLDRVAATQACRTQLRAELQVQVQQAMNTAGAVRLASR
jgi:UrcA family protein